jgi:hypothetical protein
LLQLFRVGPDAGMFSVDKELCSSAERLTHAATPIKTEGCEVWAADVTELSEKKMR